MQLQAHRGTLARQAHPGMPPKSGKAKGRKAEKARRTAGGLVNGDRTCRAPWRTGNKTGPRNQVPVGTQDAAPRQGDRKAWPAAMKLYKGAEAARQGPPPLVGCWTRESAWDRGDTCGRDEVCMRFTPRRHPHLARRLKAPCIAARARLPVQPFKVVSKALHLGLACAAKRASWPTRPLYTP